VLTLTRRIGQTILIGNDIEITVVSGSRGKVRLGIRAPRSLPVHRAEVVERVSEENRRALAQVVEQGVAAGAELRFPDGLPGLREHDAFVLCDIAPDNPIRCLVSCVDPHVQLCVIDAEEAWPGFDVDAARALYDGEDEETAVALIVTVRADGGAPTVNLAAPLVVGLESRTGRQVLLEDADHPTAAPLLVAKAG